MDIDKRYKMLRDNMWNSDNPIRHCNIMYLDTSPENYNRIMNDGYLLTPAHYKMETRSGSVHKGDENNVPLWEYVCLYPNKGDLIASFIQVDETYTFEAKDIQMFNDKYFNVSVVNGHKKFWLIKLKSKENEG